MEAPDTAQQLPDSGLVTVPCGRCGWPNWCRVQRGMRALSLVCQWCERRTIAIVDASLKRQIIL